VPSFAQVFYSLLAHGSLARDNEESQATLDAAAGVEAGSGSSCCGGIHLQHKTSNP
jgi:hypothetical protein